MVRIKTLKEIKSSDKITHVMVADKKGTFVQKMPMAQFIELTNSIVEVPTLEETPEQTLKNVFLDAYNQERTIQYTIIADSLRAGSSVELVPDYYREVLNFIDVDTYMSAASGMTSSEWVANTNPVSSARMSSAVSNILGANGVDTIVEWSLITNDYNSFTNDLPGLKATVKANIETFLALVPDVTLFIHSPSCSGTTQKGQDCRDVLSEIAEELGVFFVDGYAPTISVFPDEALGGSSSNAYYEELTHVNDNGVRRLVNNMFDKILPNEIKYHFTLPEYDTVEAETAYTNDAVIETGNWSYLGASQANANWRRMQEVTVLPNRIYEIAHLGERLDIMLEDSGGTVTRIYLPTKRTNQTSWFYQVPDDIVSIKVNVSTDGATYDGLGDTPYFRNIAQPTAYDMPQSKINLGNSIKLKS